MSDWEIDVIRRLDPCPEELPAPSIELVERRLRDQHSGGAPSGVVRRGRGGTVAMLFVIAPATAVAVALAAVFLLGHAPRAGRAASDPGRAVAVLPCRPQIRETVLPVWARAGFSEPRPRMPFVLGRSGRIAAILWGPLDSPPAADHNNKILWVARVPSQSGGNLIIQAQRMLGTMALGAPVNRTVTGGPGPSIIDLPSTGCWRLTLHWPGSTDQVDLRYRRPG